MKNLMAGLIFSAIFGLSFFASAEESESSTRLQQCLEICTATTMPGWEIRKCVANCVKRYEDNASTLFKVVDILTAKCETYEEDCERDDDDPWGGL